MNEDSESGSEIKPRLRSAVERMRDAKNEPPVVPIFGEIWQENELQIFFADTGLGKSIFATTLADAITKGQNCLGLENRVPAQHVIYYDFELSDRQFRKRYTDETGTEHCFSSLLMIDNVDFKELVGDDPRKEFLPNLMKRIRADAEETGARIIIIDNITFLNTQSPQETDVALSVMRELNDLKREIGASILVLAHTPKRPNNSPITLNDLAGSKVLSNFCDGVFAMGRSSQESSIRYLKQVKPSRSCELVYDEDNVLVCQVIKKGAFLTITPLAISPEREHLLKLGDEDNIPDKIRITAEKIKSGQSYESIAKEMGFSKGNITKWRNNEKYSHLFEDVSIVS